MNPANLSCEACFKFFDDRKKRTPCGPCQKPILLLENETAWMIFEATTTQLRIAGMGGVLGFDYSSLPFLFATYGVPETEHLILLQKLNAMYQVALKIWNKPKEPTTQKP